MRGSVLSRWSRYARVLPPTALALGSLAVLACGGNAGKTSTAPAPKDTAAPKQTASAQPAPSDKAGKSKSGKSAPSKPADTVQKPAEPAAPATPSAPPPPPPDSTAIAADFCRRVNDGVKAAINADSSLSDVDKAVQKVTAGIPEETANVALARNTTCH